MADEITDNIRSLVDRVVDAKFTQEMAKRGAEIGTLAGDAWREAEPIRRDAAKTIAQAGDEAARWSRKALLPTLKEMWNRRTVAIGAAGAAVPVGRELVDSAAVRLGIKQRQEERHWGTFFLGLVLGVVAGAIAAMLTTPKRGAELREEIGARADEIATKARDEWVPIFERATSPNGQSTVEEAATDVAEAVDSAADAATEAVSEAVETVERETS